MTLEDPIRKRGRGGLSLIIRAIGEDNNNGGGGERSSSLCYYRGREGKKERFRIDSHRARKNSVKKQRCKGEKGLHLGRRKLGDRQEEGA